VSEASARAANLAGAGVGRVSFWLERFLGGERPCEQMLQKMAGALR
jgi:hypothetical protein